MEQSADTAPVSYSVEQLASLADDSTGIVSRVDVDQTIGRVHIERKAGDAVSSSKNIKIVCFGKNVILRDGTIVATARGNLRLDDGLLLVEPLLELKADSAEGRDPIEFAGDVATKGGICDEFSLNTTGSIVVGGAVEAAQLRSMRSIYVKGGVIGKNRGTCYAQGHLWCRFLSHARILAGGDVHVQGETVNSIVQCTGKLRVFNGPICGGKITANGGIECKSIGNSAGAATHIEVGHDDGLRGIVGSAMPEIESSRKRVIAVREKIQPLMKQLRSLSPQQRERATELMYEADEIDSQTSKRCEDLVSRGRSILAKSRAEIFVSDILYQNTIIRCSGVETVIPTTFQGPMKIELRRTGARTELVICGDGKTSDYVLKSYSVDNQVDEFIRSLNDKRAA